MTETYRKWGRSVRREGEHLVRVDEAGEAIEEGAVFRTRAIEETIDLATPDPEFVDATAREIRSMIQKPLMVERLFVSEAAIAHSCERTRWTESPRRIHLSIARPPIRALIDVAQFQLDPLRQIAAALIRAGDEREPPRRIRLAEHVGAALLPHIRVEKLQSAGAHDGYGRPIREWRITSDRPPNWFRPSYRIRPRRAWFHQRVDAFGEMDLDAPVAIALLAPIGEGAIRVLCAERNRVYPTTVPIRGVAAARATETWYPYGAGAFGAELMLVSTTLDG